MGWICYGGVFYFFGSNSFSDVCYAMLEMVWTKNGDWLWIMDFLILIITMMLGKLCFDWDDFKYLFFGRH